MKTDLFQSCGHCWVFQICWHIECSTFTASSFRIWNSSTGIPSLPLALFIVMLSKAHLTSHSKMSGSRLVITSSWLSGSWRHVLFNKYSWFKRYYMPLWGCMKKKKVLHTYYRKYTIYKKIKISYNPPLKCILFIFWCISFQSSFFMKT